MNDVSAVTAIVLCNQVHQGGRGRLTNHVPACTHPAAELNDYGAHYKRRHRECRQHVPGADMKGKSQKSAGQAKAGGSSEALDEIARRGAPPGDQRADPHQEDKCERERSIDLVEEWRPDGNLHTT